MKKEPKLILVSLIIIIATVGLSYFFYFSRHIVIHEGQVIKKNIILDEGSLTLEKNSVLQGSVKINKGKIIVGEGAKIIGPVSMEEGKLVSEKEANFEGPIRLKKGDVEIGEENKMKENLSVDRGNILIMKKSILEKNIIQKMGNLRLEEEIQIDGDVTVAEVKTEKHSSTLIKGVKPKVYRTYDWPKKLQYFDVLPESHKNALGYIFLTKEKNGLIRDEKILEAHQYFEGIYDYKDGKLVSLNLEDEELMKKFFDKAKAFFVELPERRLVYFNVGATTEIYAHDSNFADIYMPSTGSDTLLIHEMGHVMDFKYDFSDLHDPKFPWTKEDALNSYGATHPGEDFAEAYQIYTLNDEAFLDLIEENEVRQEKYDFLSTYVFSQ